MPRNPNEALYGIVVNNARRLRALPDNLPGRALSGTYELPWQMLVASTFTGAAGRVLQSRSCRCATR